MTAYQFSQPWLSKLNGDMEPTAREFASLRRYLQGLDDGSVSLFNLKLLNATINSLTAGGNIAMGGFKLTGLGAGSANGDSLRYEQVIGLYLLLTGGTLSGNLAMGTNKVTGLGAASANGDAVRFEQLKYLQCVSAASNSASTTTSSTFQAATGQTVTITPTSASNRVKVTVHTPIIVTTAGGAVAFTLKRGTTELSGQTNGFAFTDFAGGNIMGIAFSYIDSPASTAATQYQVFFKSNDNTHTVQCGRTDVVASIIAEEIV